MLVGVDEGLLDEVLGGAEVAEERAHDAADVLLVAADEVGISLDLAGADAGDEVVGPGFVHPFTLCRAGAGKTEEPQRVEDFPRNGHEPAE
jgi:hypothetical protein